MARICTLCIAGVAALVLAVATPTRAAPSASFITQASDFRFKGIPKRTTPGTHLFRVRNTGRATHDFKIAGKRTRLLRSGQTQTLRVTLKRGKYVYICTVEGHAKLGMRGLLLVG